MKKSAPGSDFGWDTAEPPHSMRYLLPAIESIAPPLKEGVRVLDVGCGNGYVANWLASKGCDVTGIDISEQGITQAREAYPNIRFELAGVNKDILSPLNTDPFDLVISTEVVEHLYSPWTWAEGIFAALRPGGSIVCSTPYHGYLKNLLISFTGHWDRHMNPLRDGGHIKMWSKPTLSTLLTDSGFENVRFTGAGRAPKLWMSMVARAERPAG